jgi:hypothetical protein
MKLLNNVQLVCQPVDIQAARTSELPEDGQELMPKHVGAVIDQ